MPPRSIPHENVQEVLTLNDITTQIMSTPTHQPSCCKVANFILRLANAEVLFKQEKDLKVVSGQNENGLTHYTSIVCSDARSATGHKVGYVFVAICSMMSMLMHSR